MDHPDFYKVLAQYKFTIAMENAVCTDYVTEKFWRPFQLGTVPIVYGSPALKVRYCSKDFLLLLRIWNESCCLITLCVDVSGFPTEQQIRSFS